MKDVPSEVPAHIPAPMHGEWRAIVEDLKSRQMLTESMYGTVDSYVLALWNMRRAQEALDLHGPLIDGGKGILKQNPAATMLGKAQGTVTRLAAELGLTPASRSRPKMKGEGGDDDWQSAWLFDV
ncbi:phage terminase small subunit P27 family [Shinella sp.]|uniref:phage terminase small subunit P27 family n=1 Tax=Shinella sp. TaxID=1870904 RepID=UPI00299FFC88|nr:phage terminase small subunit P27 family [Shinella sp.]MDX3975794.1 phage terminase small subunit P27 family [Shinella sp.]